MLGELVQGLMGSFVLPVMKQICEVMHASDESLILIG